MSYPMDPTELLISIAMAALEAAEADAKESDDLIFRPEWRPTPRTRSSISQPQAHPWLNLFRNQLSLARRRLQQDQLPLRPPSAEPAPSSAPVPPPSASSVPRFQQDAVAELLKTNQDVFDEIVNHSFPRALGNGSASLDGFRYYMIQDKLYLETCARLKMIAVAAAPSFTDVEMFGKRHKSSIEYVKELKEICITMLGIPESTVDTIPRSVELHASEDFYKGSLTLLPDDVKLLGYYVILLPCVTSYWEIAKRLMEDPSTVKNVVYQRAWTDVNYDYDSVDKYTKFINENIAVKGGVNSKWNSIFRTACMLEAKLFNTGLRAPTPFRIIPDGYYFIYTFSLERVVLAIQNVKDLLRSPSNKLLARYFPSDARSSVVGVNTKGGDNEKWYIFATEYGYTFQNLGTGLYLGISTELDRKGKMLQAVSKPQCWWINTVPSQPNQGSPLYQIHDTMNLQYTLHANIEALNSVGSASCPCAPITVQENSEVSCQMWLFASCSMDQTQFGKEIGTWRPSILAKYEKEQKNLASEEAKRLRDKETRNADSELGEQLQKTQTLNAELEAERAKYMRESNFLRRELEKMRLDLRLEMEKAIAEKDEEMRRELCAEQDRLRKEMDEMIAERDEELRRELDTERTMLRKAMDEMIAEKDEESRKELDTERNRLQREMKDSTVAEKDVGLRKKLKAEQTTWQKEMEKWDAERKQLAGDLDSVRQAAVVPWEEGEREMVLRCKEEQRPDVIIGVMGPTGAGKSSLIRLITDHKSVRSVTSEVDCFRYFERDGRCVTFIDTPGFDVSREGITDTDVLRTIASFLNVEFKGDKKLSGIIYLHRITDPRMGGISNRNLNIFKKLCGEDALKNIIIVTTWWDDIPDKDREVMGRREEELMKSKGKFFEPFIAAGGRFLRHDNTFRSACRIMDQLLDNDPITLQIQDKITIVPKRRPDAMIGIIGSTGTGKSSFIRVITGHKSVHSMISKVDCVHYFENDGHCVTFIDTPGFDPYHWQGITDTDILRTIAAFLDVEFKDGKKLSGIIYLHRITDPRMGGTSRRNLKMFKELCEELKNVVVVTTWWDDVPDKEREAMGKREEELMKTKGKFFEPLIAAGARYLRHDNTIESARRIMDQLLNNDPIDIAL